MKKISIPRALDTVEELMRKQYKEMSKETLIDIMMNIAIEDLKKLSFKELEELLFMMSGGQLVLEKVRPDMATIQEEDLKKAIEDFDKEEE